MRNNLGLSLCAVPQSAVVYVVAYFRRTKLLPGVQERSGILIRVRIECKGNWAQDSRRILSNITDCGYGTTHLQENPQRLG